MQKSTTICAKISEPTHQFARKTTIPMSHTSWTEDGDWWSSAGGASPRLVKTTVVVTLASETDPNCTDPCTTMSNNASRKRVADGPPDGGANEEDGESCIVCMSLPRTIRNQPCGHAIACELCTVKDIARQGAQARFRCMTCRGKVTSVGFVAMQSMSSEPPRVRKMATYLGSGSADAGVTTTFANVREFLVAMRERSSPEGIKVAAAAALGEEDGIVAQFVAAYRRRIEEEEPHRRIERWPPIDNHGHAVVPANVTILDDDAFHGCSSLSAVELPAGLTSIGGRAFDGCYGIASVDVPADCELGFGCFSPQTDVRRV